MQVAKSALCAQSTKSVSPLKQSQLWLKEIVKPGDEVVDATLGNGHDTLFLLNCLKQIDGQVQGFLWGFDIQQQALHHTKVRLDKAGISAQNYALHLQSHSELAQVVASNQLTAVMFNLGYLPGADKTLITQTEQTLEALAAGLSKLKPQGVLSVMCYPGHEGGDSESAAVVSWVDSLDVDQFCVVRVNAQYINAKSAFLLWVQKLEQ